MKVTILTEGGKDIGYGHITRCTSIYQAFEEIGIQSQLIVNGDGTIEYLLKGKNYKVFNWLNNEELFEILGNSNIVFIDSYLAKYEIYERISEQVETAVYFDDDLRIDYPKGFVLNGAISAEHLPYPRKDDVTYLLGTMYTPIRREFWDVPPKLIRKNIETLLITFGGSDMCNVTPKIQKLLNDIYPNLQKKIILTKCFANIPIIEKLRDKNTDLIFDPDTIELIESMQESDIAISAGGQTLYELARVGVPTIGICLAQNQLQNVNGWSKSRLLEYIGWYNDENLLNNLRDAISKLTPYKERLTRSEKSRNYINGQGCKRIINAINSQ